MSTNSAPGWYSDPTARFENRYWDGVKWTDAVSTGRSNSNDPLSSSAALAPPAPGTETHVAAAPQQPASIHVTTEGGKSGGSFMGFILGALAVVVAGAILIAVLANGDDGDGDGENTPTTTEAPASDEGE